MDNWRGKYPVVSQPQSRSVEQHQPSSLDLWLPAGSTAALEGLGEVECLLPLLPCFQAELRHGKPQLLPEAASTAVQVVIRVVAGLVCDPTCLVVPFNTPLPPYEQSLHQPLLEDPSLWLIQKGPPWETLGCHW